MSNFEAWLDENNISVNEIIAVTKSYCRKMGGNQDLYSLDYDDVSQEVLLKLFKFYHKYNKERAKATTFIRQVQISKIKDCLYSEKANRLHRNTYTFDKDAKNYATLFIGEQMEYELSYESEELEDITLFDTLRSIRFTDKEKKVINFRLKGYQKSEIAVLLKVSPSRVSELLNSIRNKMNK